MNNKDTADHLRRWCATPRRAFSWPTDGCGYDQHMRFLEYRNEHWKGEGDFTNFVLSYADRLENGAQ